MRCLRAAVVLALVSVVAGATPAGANHYYTKYGWRDKHVLYPSFPSGYSQIVKVFGNPCNAAVKPRTR